MGGVWSCGSKRACSCEDELPARPQQHARDSQTSELSPSTMDSVVSTVKSLDGSTMMVVYGLWHPDPLRQHPVTILDEKEEDKVEERIFVSELQIEEGEASKPTGFVFIEGQTRRRRARPIARKTPTKISPPKASASCSTLTRNRLRKPPADHITPTRSTGEGSGSKKSKPAPVRAKSPEYEPQPVPMT